MTEFKSVASFNEHFEKTAVTAVPKIIGHAVDVLFQDGTEDMNATFATDVPQMNVHFPIPPGTQTSSLAKPACEWRIPISEAES